MLRGTPQRLDSNGTSILLSAPFFPGSVHYIPVRGGSCCRYLYVKNRHRSFCQMPRKDALRTRVGAQRAIYVVFDPLHLDGRDLRRRPLEERRALLADLVANAHGNRSRSNMR